MHTQNLCFCLFLLCLGGCQEKESTSPALQPNIIFIMADDMGYGDLGCYNPDSKIPTPNMDMLAKEGIRLTQAHSPSSVCSPTRYGVLTGRYAWRTWLKKGALGPFDKLMIDTARLTVADVLKQKGYATAAIGKWHMGLGYADSIDYYHEPLKPGPLELGFDYFFGMNASLNMSPHCFIEGYHTVGTPDVPVPDHLFSNHGNKMMSPGWDHKDVGPTFTQKAVSFIENHVTKNPKKPFYLHLTPSAPHRPYYPPDFLRSKSRAGKRGDMVAEVDWTVGEIMRLLEAKNLIENTLLVITSDNGAIEGNTSKSEDSLAVPVMYDHRSNGPWRGTKTMIWEGGHRVPFIARWPQMIPKGSTSNELFCLTDWMKTVAAIVGAEIPSNAAEDSYNMLPALTQASFDSPIREALVTHSMWGKFAITQKDWKLILTQSSGGWGSPPEQDYPPGQLYHLSTDSVEQQNVYHQHPDVVGKLEDLLEQYRQSDRSTPVEH